MVDVFRVAVSTLSGQAAEVELRSAATVGELRAAVWSAFGLDSGSSELRLALGDVVLAAGDAAPISEVGVVDGSRITAVLRARTRLMPVPPHFRVVLTSSRRRLGFNSFSSAFTECYHITVNAQASRISGVFVRKNDSDKIEIDGQLGKRSGTTGHWMTGDRVFESDVATFDLAPLLTEWADRIEEVPEDEPHVWVEPGLAEPPHWFAAVCGCTELRVDLLVPVLPRGDPIVLARLLVDAEGRPVRAALCDAGDRHDHEPRPEGVRRANPQDMARGGQASLEEFDVEFEELSEPQEPTAFVE